MNVLISVDMEGISGVVAADHTSLSHKESLNGLVVGDACRLPAGQPRRHGRTDPH